jgi:fatty acid desaturase
MNEQKANRYNDGLPFVAADKVAAPAPIVRRMAPEALQNIVHTIDVQPSATQHIEMKTSAVDRSKGFLIATVPLFAAFAVGAVLIAYIAFDVPVLSVAALTIFWLTFVLAWAASYIYTLAISAEGIARYESKRKWDVVEREQTERWNYYNKQIGGE